ncbi:hypothetical protein [Kushneria indalinina]|uniref:Uncharacterized protein n=1 Tax=Kushneria indalinina DSM 14324 TaxID=1122140 RepID=A0A3D9DRR2_9GAMM|nr:hypothetical protein [Kushneria indalinina]REC93376.1 hypothetical protein C8D72_3420 [Kushneria indalinina DSM 14324]
MKLSDLLSPKGRKATAQLAMDLSRITGKAAAAGASGLFGAAASAASGSANNDDASNDSHMFSYGKSSDGFGDMTDRNV